MNISVKNVPEPVYWAIQRQAKKNSRSLNAEVIQVLEKEAAQAERPRNLKGMTQKLREFAASLSPTSDRVLP